MLKHPSLHNKTTDVVIHQHSRKLLKMDTLMSETCWAHNKGNKIASDIKLVFHSSTVLSRFMSQSYRTVHIPTFISFRHVKLFYFLSFFLSFYLSLISSSYFFNNPSGCNLINFCQKYNFFPFNLNILRLLQI